MKTPNAITSGDFMVYNQRLYKLKPSLPKLFLRARIAVYNTLEAVGLLYHF